VAANLYSDLFRKAAPRLWPAIKPWGRLIISGLMLDQVKSVTEKLNEFCGRIEAKRVRGKWVTMLVQRTET
jgi:ribosomal protein L11 methylase PrmA